MQHEGGNIDAKDSEEEEVQWLINEEPMDLSMLKSSRTYIS